MLESVTHANGLVTLQSPRLRGLGVPHGFSARGGGVSQPPYHSLNLGLLRKGPGTDANLDVAENFRRLRAALGLARFARMEAPQVHGSVVWSCPPNPIRFADAPRADALTTTHRMQVLVCRTADCVPVLLATGDGRVVGAAHAGWRGLIAGVVPNAVDALREAAAVAGTDCAVTAAIGPCIGVARFEVGDEVAAAFDDAGLGDSVRREPGHKAHVDLTAAATAQLHDAGIAPDAIDAYDGCTYDEADHFFSYRRDGETGRMAAVIARV